MLYVFNPSNNRIIFQNYSIGAKTYRAIPVDDWNLMKACGLDLIYEGDDNFVSLFNEYDGEG